MLFSFFVPILIFRDESSIIIRDIHREVGILIRRVLSVLLALCVLFSAVLCFADDWDDDDWDYDYDDYDSYDSDWDSDW